MLLSVIFPCLLLFLCPVVFLWPGILCRRWISSRFRQFFCHGNMKSSVGYVFYFGCFINWLVVIACLGLFEFRNFVNFLPFSCSNLHASAKLLFVWQLWHIDSRGWTFMVRIAIWCVTISTFSLVWSLFWSCSVFSRMWYSVYKFIPDAFFSRFDLSSSDMVFFLFLRSFVFCWIYSTTFHTSECFSFSSLSRSFLSVIDVLSCDINISVLNSGKSHCFSSSNFFSQWTSGVSVSVCFAQNILLFTCICFISVSNIRYNIW